jgi:hypothetical protein
MYRNARDAHQPVRAVTRRIIGVTARGNRVNIEPQHAGLGYFAFMPLYFQPMWRGDASVAQEFARRINVDRDDPIVEFRLVNRIYTITKRGLVKEDQLGHIYRVGE